MECFSSYFFSFREERIIQKKKQKNPKKQKINKDTTTYYRVIFFYMRCKNKILKVKETPCSQAKIELLCERCHSSCV